MAMLRSKDYAEQFVLLHRIIIIIIQNGRPMLSTHLPPLSQTQPLDASWSYCPPGDVGDTDHPLPPRGCGLLMVMDCVQLVGPLLISFF